MPTIDLTRLREIVNDVYWPLFGDRSRTLILPGGGGSGKSFWVPQKLALRMMTEEGHHIVAFRKVGRTCKASVWSQMLNTIESLGTSSLWRKNLSDLTLKYMPNGNVFRCLGMDDPEKIKSIVDDRGNNITSAWLEEATEMTPADVSQINLRMRGRVRSYKQMILSFNPISSLHWLNQRFFAGMGDNQRDYSNGNVRIVRTTYKDNRFIDKEYAQELEALRDIDEQLWRVYACGLWGVLKGLVYEGWGYSEPPAHPDETIWGLDFGYNNPMALIRLDIKDDILYATEKIYETGLTTADLISRMNSLSVGHNNPIYADTSEPDRIEEVSRAGYNIMPADKAPGSVNAGISVVKHRARTKRLFTNEGNVNINNELQTYKWREDKNGNFLDDVVKFNDHALDAIRYAIFTHFSTDQFGIG